MKINSDILFIFMILNDVFPIYFLHTDMDTDRTAPVITGCPTTDIITQVTVGSTGGVVRWTEPQATDDSGASPARVRSHTPGSIFPLGTTRVTYTFTDGSANAATCQFNVRVNTGTSL